MKRVVFTRDATGLVRAWSPFDMFVYGWMSAVGIWSPALIFIQFYGGYAFPDGSPPLAMILCAILVVPLMLVYAMLGVSMPRSGGDYVFSSRILPPALAFAVFIPEMIFFQQWNYWNGFSIATIGIAPLAQLNGMTSLASWIVGPSGVLFITVTLIAVAGIVMMKGMYFYRKFQRALFVLEIASIIVFFYMILSSTQAHFVQSFNSFMGPALNSNDSYSYIINSAVKGGYNPNVGVTLAGTVGILPFAAGALVFAMQGTINIGEIKSAANFRNMALAMIAADFVGALVLAGMFYVVPFKVGADFIGAISYHFNNGTPVALAMGSPPFITEIASLMTNVPVLVWFLCISAAVSNFLPFPGTYIVGSRYLFAMSFDRVLPAAMSAVNERYHAPINAIAIMGAAQVLWALLFTYTNLGISGALASVIFVQFAAFTLACLCAIILPFRKATKSVFNSSPVSGYKIGGIPLMAIVGVGALAVMGLFFYQYATVSALGANNPTSATYMAASLVVGAVIFYICRIIRRGQGVDLNWVFAEIPPE